jgi:hypothetical protein
LNLLRLSALLFGTILLTNVITIITTRDGFIIPALANDLTSEDQISLQDPLQDRVTICHIPHGNSTKAHDMTVGEDAVPYHLAHGDRLGSCSPTINPTIEVEPPSTCIRTENGLVGYARFILSGFPIGTVLIMDSQFSEPLQEVEVQAKIHSVPVGFSTGEKTVKVFADTNRNLQQDPGEVSSTKSFTITC